MKKIKSEKIIGQNKKRGKNQNMILASIRFNLEDHSKLSSKKRGQLG